MNNNSSQETLGRGQKHRRAKWPLLLLTVLVIAAAGYLCYSKVVVGWLTTDVTVESIEVFDDGITLTGELNGFAGLRGHSVTIDEDIATVELDCTWPVFGRRSDFTIIFEDDFSGVREVNISDGRNQLVIWGEE